MFKYTSSTIIGMFTWCRKYPENTKIEIRKTLLKRLRDIE